jgi:hypothetical protein
MFFRKRDISAPQDSGISIGLLIQGLANRAVAKKPGERLTSDNKLRVAARARAGLGKWLIKHFGVSVALTTKHLSLACIVAWEINVFLIVIE